MDQPGLVLTLTQVEDDGKTDVCVMCHHGGKLICCEICPAAFHMRYALNLPPGLSVTQRPCFF